MTGKNESDGFPNRPTETPEATTQTCYSTRKKRMKKSQSMLFVLAYALCSLLTQRLHADEFWTRNPGWLAEFWQAAPETGKSLGIDAQKVEGEYPARLHVSNFVDEAAAVTVHSEVSKTNA